MSVTDEKGSEQQVYEAETCTTIECDEVTGQALICKDPISFLGQIDPETGDALEGIEIQGESVKDKILVYPTGAGSTVGSYVLLNLKKNGAAPKGIINRVVDTVVLSGAIWADIPVAHRFKDGTDPLDAIRTGDVVTIKNREKKVIVVRK
jgi:predicted aconitase with swiveling domain